MAPATSEEQAGNPIFLVTVLLRMGFAEHPSSPSGRWALTSPFHPYWDTLSAVYFCCTFLEVAFTGCYPAPLPCGARTFLVRGLSALRPRPSDLLINIY